MAIATLHRHDELRIPCWSCQNTLKFSEAGLAQVNELWSLCHRLHCDYGVTHLHCDTTFVCQRCGSRIRLTAIDLVF